MARSRAANVPNSDHDDERRAATAKVPAARRWVPVTRRILGRNAAAGCSMFSCNRYRINCSEVSAATIARPPLRCAAAGHSEAFRHLERFGQVVLSRRAVARLAARKPDATE